MKIIARSFGCLLALALLFFVIPTVGQSILHAMTPSSNIKDWKAEYDRLDGLFPRVAANETKRLEMIRKLRQRGIRIDEGPDESIDHQDTPYALFMRGWRDWQRWLGK